VVGSVPARIELVSDGYARRLERRRRSPDESLWALLDDVVDPEIPVLSLWDLGVLQDLHRDGADVVVVITPTYSGCPALHAMTDAIRARLVGAGYPRVRIVTSLSPPWTTEWMSADARRQLREYGIAPPDVEAVVCPQCGAAETAVISQFGSTACKALYRCGRCGEPFDYFKPI
jgi:ring-1,2-phenylacetyl-CoA epoxidase subunit PaaD